MISFIAQTVAGKLHKAAPASLEGCRRSSKALLVGTWGSAGKVPKAGVLLFREHMGILTGHETKINVSHMR